MTSRLITAGRLFAGLVFVLCCVAVQARADCGIWQFKKHLLHLENKDWVPSKALERAPQIIKSGRGGMAPVTGIAVQVRRVWVETYYGEFNTVGLRVSDNQVWLKPLMFVMPTPRGDNRIPNLVAPYADNGVRFGLSPYQGDCTFKTMVLTIENIPVGKDRVSERWLFVRKK